MLDKNRCIYVSPVKTLYSRLYIFFVMNKYKPFVFKIIKLDVRPRAAARLTEEIDFDKQGLFQIRK